MQHIEQRAVRDAARELLLCDRLTETIEKGCARLRIDDVPHLRLAVLAFGTHGVGVVRMHLHGEIVPRVDELDEQREVGKTLRTAAKRAPSLALQPR